MRRIKYKAVDFFCGAGGMTHGFRKAGVDVIAGIDFDQECQATYETNNVGSLFLLSDIKTLKYSTLTKLTHIRKNDDNLIFIGCSPCQYWSKIKTDKSKSEESKNLLKDFSRFVEYYNPGTVVIENVPGILSSKEESPLGDFLSLLANKNYKFASGIINASHYGVPQTRRRFLLIASRIREIVVLPKPNTERPLSVRDFISAEYGFPILEAGATDSSTSLHATASLSATNLQRIRMTPADGGTRLSYVEDEQLAVPSQFKRRDAFSDTYGRMKWDRPAPTITTKFVSLSNGRFGHPVQDRALSLREGATLQTFDRLYDFKGGSLRSIARQIGNAVPPLLAEHIARSIIA